jgi:hypothetical protein
MKFMHFVDVVGITNKIFKSLLVSRHPRIPIYKTLARPTLSYSSEGSTIRRNDEGDWHKQKCA